MPETLEQEEAPKKSGTSKCLTCGCIGLLIMAVVGTGIGFVAWSNARSITASVALWGFETSLDAIPLPEEQRSGIIEQAARLKTAYVNEELTDEQYGDIFEQFVESPILPVGTVLAARSGILDPSGLSDAEADAGTLQLQRIARGLYEDDLIQADLEYVMDPVMVIQGGNMQLKQNITDDDVRAMLALAEERADEKGLSIEPFEVDIAAEFKRIIDNVSAAPTPIEH
jgi:hypothetical protein